MPTSSIAIAAFGLVLLAGHWPQAATPPAANVPSVKGDSAAATPPAPAQAFWTPQPLTLAPETAAELAALMQAVSTERLMSTIKSLPPRRSAGPTAEHAGRLAATQDLLSKELTALGAEFTTQRVALRRSWGPGWSAANPSAKPVGKPSERPADAADPVTPQPTPAPQVEPGTLHEWVNFSIDLPGQSLPREVVLIAAHFDSFPDAPGADDNGTGTAAILEMVRLLRPLRHDRTIRLCLFNHEEIGLIGSTHSAKVWQERNKTLPAAERESIVGMISLDMLGFFSEGPNSQQNPFKNVPGGPTGSVGDFLALCGSSKHRTFNRELASAMITAEPECKTVLIDLFPNEQMAFMPPDLLRSDHAPFLNIGVAAVLITDTANLRSPHYHQPTDTIETLDAARFTAGVRAITGAAWLLARPQLQPPVNPPIKP